MDNSNFLKNPARIWTFDGGGPSVISQLIIINEIMLQIQWIRKLTEVPRPCEYADLMVGSAMGAIVVVLLARLRLTAEEALGHLISLGQDVFIAPNESTNGPKFDVERLSSAIRGILKDCGLDDTTKMIENAVISGQTYAALTAVPTSDLSTCRLLRTYRVPGANSDCTIVNAVLATTALPDWFPAVTIGSIYSKEQLIGGSIGFNNPTKKALEEAARLFGSEHQVSIIISFGTGQQQTRSLTKSNTEGLQEVLSAMVQEGDSVTDDLAQRFNGSSFYHRFSVESGIGAVTITEWSESELRSITSRTKSYMERNSSSLDAVVKKLVENKGSHTLGQITHVKTNATTAKSVPRLSPYYVSRDEVYDSMERCLIRDFGRDQRLFVIMGMGGVGKTQSASFFARRNRDRYQYVIFVDASSAESIKADLQSAIRSLGGKHSQDGFEDVFQFLADADNRNWLIIFDNADDPDLPLTTYIPKCEHGTIVITGRNHHLIQLAPASYLRLQGMTDSDSIQVLLKAAQRDLDGNEEEMASAIELCRSLGGLPLALVHVGCYCHTAQKSFSKYLKIFKEHRSKLMEMKPSAQLDEYSYSTYTSIHLSYSLLDESARKLFHLLAFFHPSSICVDIFQATVRYESLYWETLPREEQYGERWSSLRQILAPAGSWNDIYIDNLLHQLQNFSLISLSHLNEQTNITLHPLVKSCILDTLLPEDYSLYFYMAVLVLSSCGYREETHLFQYLTTHVAEMESCNMHIHPNDIAAFAYILYQNGNREESMKRWEIVRYWRKRVNGEQHKSTLRISFWIADCLRHLNRVEEAEAIIREVVGTQEKLLGGDHQHTFDSYRLLADILSEQSKTEEAEDILKHLLTLNGTKYDADDPTTLLVQSSLVDNLRIQHRLSETEALSKKILPTMREIFEEDDDITLHTLNNLSLALINQKKWAEAEDILSDVVAKRTRRYGKQHISTLTSLGNLAVCRLGRGKLNEADTIFREVLELRERTLGKDHPSTIHTRRWLEDVTQAQKSLRATTVQPGAHQGI